MMVCGECTALIYSMYSSGPHIGCILLAEAARSAVQAGSGDGDDSKDSRRSGRAARSASASGADEVGKKRVRKPPEKLREEPVRGPILVDVVSTESGACEHWIVRLRQV